MPEQQCGNPRVSTMIRKFASPTSSFSYSLSLLFLSLSSGSRWRFLPFQSCCNFLIESLFYSFNWLLMYSGSHQQVAAEGRDSLHYAIALCVWHLLAVTSTTHTHPLSLCLPFIGIGWNRSYLFFPHRHASFSPCKSNLISCHFKALKKC